MSAARRWPYMIPILALLACSAASHALPPWERDDREPLRLPDGSTFQPAVLIENKPPKYPRELAWSQFEGWVAVGFVVTPDGAVRDVQVLDSSGDREFEREAVAAARQFRYEPARINDEPVEQAVPMFRIIFSLGGPSGIAQTFRRRVREIDRMIQSGRLVEAKQALDSFAERPRRTLSEDAVYWWLHAAYAGARGDSFTRQESLRRAVALSDDYLPREYYLDALRMLYTEYVRAGELRKALIIYERIMKHIEPDIPPAALRAHSEQIRAVLASEAELLAHSQLDVRAWVHRLSRNTFQFVDVEGRLEYFNLWCERRAQQFEATADAAWSVPPSWGECTLILNGQPGTRFGIWEYVQVPPGATE